MLVLLIAVGAWYFLKPDNESGPNSPNPTSSDPFGFVPIGTSPISNGNPSIPTATSTDPEGNPQIAPIKTLRLLSNTPVGGFGVNNNSSTTIIRWVERGRGNVLEVDSYSPAIRTISNTLVPRIFESVWNKNLSAFVGSMLAEKASEPNFVYSELKKQVSNATSSDSESILSAQYELQGKSLPDDILAYAVSPSGDKVFLLIKESEKGVGYIAKFDGTGMVRLFDSPITSVNVEWPETNTIAITTKGSSSQSGFLYFVNSSTGAMRKVLGPIYGLSTKVSRDAKQVLASSVNRAGNGIDTAIYTISSNTTLDATIKTLADKCVWGNFYKEIVYCAVPTLPPSGTLPDGWYRGSISFNDKMWQVNAKTGEVKLLMSLTEESDRIIDGFNLAIDASDEFLVFMNKNDLSLWSLDLVSSQ